MMAAIMMDAAILYSDSCYGGSSDSRTAAIEPWLLYRKAVI